MKRTRIKMNKSVYLGLSILDTSKIVRYDCWYGYVKPKYGKKTTLCYRHTDSFIVLHVISEDIYADLAGDVKKRFDTSKRPLPIEKSKKRMRLLRDGLCGKIMKEFVALRPKMFSCLTNVGSVTKKAKGTKKCVFRQEIKFQDYKEFYIQISESQHRFRSESHNVFFEKVNKNALNALMIRAMILQRKSWNSVKRGIKKTPKNKKLNIMINVDEVTEENIQEHNPRWPQIPDHPYRKPKTECIT